MGAKDWMVMYADGDVRQILQSNPALDRAATEAMVGRLYDGYRISRIDDGDLFRANPPEGHVYAGCFPGLAIVCTTDVAIDHPSRLDDRFRAEGARRTLYLHAMHSVVDWFAYAIWDRAGNLERSLSLSADDGIVENIGEQRPFEAPYWAGDRPADDDEESEYPLPFHPLELAEEALRDLFGFVYEGVYHDDDPDPETIALAGFAVSRRRFWQRRGPGG